MAAENILNFIRIDPRVALGGQPDEGQFRALRDEGCELVINLAPGDHESAIANQPALLKAIGLAYEHIPVPWDAPAIEQYRRFVAAMDAAGERSVLVHCAANFRVTAFYGLYAQQRLGWSEKEADALFARVWGVKPETLTPDGPAGPWKRFIDEARDHIKTRA